MTNCVFAKMVWGWEVERGDDPKLVGYVDARRQARRELSELIEGFDGDLQLDTGFEFDVYGYREVQSIEDFGDDECLTENFDAADIAKLHELVSKCSTMRQMDQEIIRWVVARYELPSRAVGLLHFFEVSDAAFDGSEMSPGDYLVGVGMLGLVNFALVHREVVVGMDAKGADYHTWVTGES